MADFIQDQIKNNQNNPQVLTKSEAKQLQKEVGDETYQKMISDNIITIKEILQNNNKIESKSLKNEEQDKNKKEQDRAKIEQRHQQLIASLRSFSGDIKSSISSLTNTGLNKISDLLGGYAGKLTQAAFEAARVGVKLSFVIDAMQKQRNIEYLKTHSLSSAGDPNFVTKANKYYTKLLDRGIDYGMNKDEVDTAMQELGSSMNMKRLKDHEQLKTAFDYFGIANKSFRAAAGSGFSELYKTMLAQGGLSSKGAFANLNAFNRAFEYSPLGTEKSLQLSKQLYESNRRFHMSMNESAGYINKFNKELQAGTSTLSDITAVKTTLKTKGSGDLAGLGQMIVNMGLGTDEMNKAAGNPFALAEILRKGDQSTIDALQQAMDKIAEGANFGQGTEGRSDYLRNLWSNFGFSLNEDIINKLTAGESISAYDLGFKKKKGETPEQAKEREAKEFIDLMLKVNKETVDAKDTYEAQMIRLVQEISSKLGEEQSKLSAPNSIGDKIGGALYLITHPNNNNIYDNTLLMKLNAVSKSKRELDNNWI